MKNVFVRQREKVSRFVYRTPRFFHHFAPQPLLEAFARLYEAARKVERSPRGFLGAYCYKNPSPLVGYYGSHGRACVQVINEAAVAAALRAAVVYREFG